MITMRAKPVFVLRLIVCCLTVSVTSQQQQIFIQDIVASKVEQDGMLEFDKLIAVLHDAERALGIPPSNISSMEQLNISSIQFDMEEVTLNALAFVTEAKAEQNGLIEGIVQNEVEPDGIKIDQLKDVFTKVAVELNLQNSYPSNEVLQNILKYIDADQLFDKGAVKTLCQAFVASENPVTLKLVKQLVTKYGYPDFISYSIEKLHGIIEELKQKLHLTQSNPTYDGNLSADQIVKIILTNMIEKSTLIRDIVVTKMKQDGLIEFDQLITILKEVERKLGIPQSNISSVDEMFISKLLINNEESELTALLFVGKADEEKVKLIRQIIEPLVVTDDISFDQLKAVFTEVAKGMNLKESYPSNEVLKKNLDLLSDTQIAKDSVEEYSIAFVISEDQHISALIEDSFLKYGNSDGSCFYEGLKGVIDNVIGELKLSKSFPTYVDFLKKKLGGQGGKLSVKQTVNIIIKYLIANLERTYVNN